MTSAIVFWIFNKFSIDKLHYMLTYIKNVRRGWRDGSVGKVLDL